MANKFDKLKNNQTQDFFEDDGKDVAINTERSIDVDQPVKEQQTEQPTPDFDLENLLGSSNPMQDKEPEQPVSEPEPVQDTVEEPEQKEERSSRSRKRTSVDYSKEKEVDFDFMRLCVRKLLKDVINKSFRPYGMDIKEVCDYILCINDEKNFLDYCNKEFIDQCIRTLIEELKNNNFEVNGLNTYEVCDYIEKYILKQ